MVRSAQEWRDREQVGVATQVKGEASDLEGPWAVSDACHPSLGRLSPGECDSHVSNGPSRPGTEGPIPADQPLCQLRDPSCGRRASERGWHWMRELDRGGADQESSAPPKALPLTASQALTARPSGPELEGFIWVSLQQLLLSLDLRPLTWPS